MVVSHEGLVPRAWAAAFITVAENQSVFSTLCWRGIARYVSSSMCSCTWLNGWMHGYLKSIWSRSNIQKQVWGEKKKLGFFFYHVPGYLNITLFLCLTSSRSYKTFNIRTDDLAKRKGHARNEGHIKYRTPALKLQEFIEEKGTPGPGWQRGQEAGCIEDTARW